MRSMVRIVLLKVCKELFPNLIVGILFVLSVQTAKSASVQNCRDTLEISYRPYCEGMYNWIPGFHSEIIQDPTNFGYDGSSSTMLTLNCYAPKTNGPGEDILYTWSCMANSPGRGGPPPPPPPRCPVQAAGSVIRVEEGSVAEDVEITGTPFKLIYTSQRTIGHVKAFKLPIVTGTDSASGFSGTNYTVNFGNGRTATYSHTANQSATFIWDGKNASGNYTEGPTKVDVQSVDIYNSVPSTATLTNTYSLGTWNVLLAGLGGWNFDVHHRYDTAGKKIYLGSGSIVSADYELDGSALRVVAENGSEIYYFDSNGRHLTTNNILTNAVIYTFNYLSNGYLSSIIDAYGNTTSVIRNFSGDATGIQSPYGHVTLLNIGVDGYLASIQNPKGETHSMTYYAGGLLHTFQMPRGQVSTMTYDSEGSLTLDSSSAGNFTAIAVTQNNVTDRTIVVSDALGTASTINLSMGNDYASRNEVDRSGQPRGMYTDVNVGLTTSDPRSANSMSFENDPRFGSALKRPKILSNNVFGTNPYTATYSYSVVNTSTTSTPFNYDSLQTTADINGKVGTSTYVRSTGVETSQSPAGRYSSVTKDSLGKMTSYQFASFLPTQFSYDTRGRLRYQTQGSRQIENIYNSSGDLTAVKNPLNQTTSYTYDLAGRVLTKVYPDLRAVGFTHDANGNLASITPAGSNAHSFNFNPFDLPDYYAPPVLPTSTPSTYYTYDNIKRITQITKPDLSTVVFNYDPTNGLLTSITASGDTTTFTLNTIGKVTSAVSQDGISTTQSFAGDYLINAQGVAPGWVNMGRVDFVYNSDLRPTKLTLNDVNSVGYDIAYTYDNDGILKSVGAMAMSLDATTGQKTKTVLNKIQEIYSFDASYGEPVSFTAKYVPNATTSTPLFIESYTRDALGRLATKTETVGTTTNQFAYTYDTSGRLTDVTKNSSGYSHYNFSDNNNLTSGSVAGVSFTATYDAQDRISTYSAGSSISFTHTPNGEMKTKTVGSTVTTYTWDGFGMLKTAKVGTGAVITYLYDGLNRLVGRKSGSTVQKYWLYQDQLRIAAELNTSGVITKKFIYGTKVNVPDYIIIGSTTYKIISDYLGSVRMVVNASNGSIAQKIEYNELGAVISDTSPGFQPFYFAGGVYDTTTKLLHFGARDYDPSIGRWLSKDLILFNGGDTNLYGYVLNDPINFYDDTGFSAKGAYKGDTGGGGPALGGGGQMPSGGGACGGSSSAAGASAGAGAAPFIFMGGPPPKPPKRSCSAERAACFTDCASESYRNSHDGSQGRCYMRCANAYDACVQAGGAP